MVAIEQKQPDVGLQYLDTALHHDPNHAEALLNSAILIQVERHFYLEYCFLRQCVCEPLQTDSIWIFLSLCDRYGTSDIVTGYCNLLKGYIWTASANYVSKLGFPICPSLMGWGGC